MGPAFLDPVRVLKREQDLREPAEAAPQVRLVLRRGRRAEHGRPLDDKRRVIKRQEGVVRLALPRSDVARNGLPVDLHAAPPLVLAGRLLRIPRL